jgi:predicted nuclease of predicted toxin-antitoxin system
MRFLVDECTGPAVARWLRVKSHEVYSVYEEAPGSADNDLLDKAFLENWILITTDKDFGERVYRERKPHRGWSFFAFMMSGVQQKLTRFKSYLIDTNSN